MPTPATELQKLMELRDAGEITPEEFEKGKAGILASVSSGPLPVKKEGLFDRFTANMLTLVVSIGVLVGATTLIAMTEAGAIALLSLALIAIVFVGIWIFKESW